MGNQWWLRAQDEVFGPVTRDNLLEWAQMGRIQPGQDVSEDGENWKPATEIAFLDMRWSIDIGDGTPRGPFNKQAAQALLASGRLPRGSKLVEVVPEPVDQKAEPEPAPQKDEPAAQAQSACVDEQKVASSNEIAELRQQLETLQAGLRAAEARAAEAERRVDEARREAKTAVKAADVAEARLAAIQAETAQKDADLAAAHAAAAKAREEAEFAVAAAKKDASTAVESALESARLQAGKAAAELAAKNEALAAKESEIAAIQREAAAELAARETEHAAEIAARETELKKKETALAEKDAALAAKDTALAEKETALAEKDSALTAAHREASEAESMAKAAESDLADLFSSAQANEAAYENRIQSLSEEIKRLPPTAQLAADAQAAVYALMKEESDELAAALEAENREAEAFRQYRRQRTERLLARRQEILRRLGTDVDDMTRRALKAHPEDPRTAHLRQELDALRILQERSALEADRKIRDLSAKLRESVSEVNRLRAQSVDVTVIYRQLQDAREKLSAREKDLVEERQKSEIERQQHAAAQQALLTRLSSLEMGMPGATNQSREARSVRLAPWMGLKK